MLAFPSFCPVQMSVVFDLEESDVAIPEFCFTSSNVVLCVEF